jgi:hypothetical protein
MYQNHLKIWETTQILIIVEFRSLYKDSGHGIGNRCNAWFNVVKLNLIQSVNNTVRNL